MSTRALFFFVAVLLLILFVRFLSFKAPLYRPGETVTFRQTLTDQPKIKGLTQQFWMDGYKIFVVAPRFPEYHYGDTLTINGTLEKRVLNNNRSILSLYFPKIKATQNDNYLTQSGLAVSRFVRQKMHEILASSLPSTSASLLLGILLGVKEDMPNDFFDDLKRTGTLHVVAASGMNVSIVSGFLFSFLVLLVRRQIALMLAMVGILFYAGIAGFEPSIVRASIMGVLAFTAQILGRQNLSFFSLFVAAFLMLFIDPTLVYDIGFQLSFLATLGLITFKPILDRHFPNITLLKDSFTTTLAAQIFTLPILLANFGTISLLSIFANVLVLWTIPTIMVLGGMASLVGIVLKPLATIVLYLCFPFLAFFELAVRMMAGLPGQIAIEQLPLIMGVGYYLVLLSVTMALNQVKR